MVTQQFYEAIAPRKEAWYLADKCRDMCLPKHWEFGVVPWRGASIAIFLLQFSFGKAPLSLTPHGSTGLIPH